MKHFIYIIIVLVFIGCAKNSSKELDDEVSKASSVVEEEISITQEDAYVLLIKQKIQESIDKSVLAKKHPDFTIENKQEEHFSTEEKTIKDVTLIAPFKILSDSVKTIKTKVIYESRIDTLITHIKTSKTEIDGEQLKITMITFSSPKKKDTPSSKQPDQKPIHVERFSVRDLSFTWEEINACDCLFMVNAKNTSYKRLYFGRFKDNANGIIQQGKNTEKYLIPVLKPRSAKRKPGSFWRETYQNNRYKIELKASPTTAKVKGKHTYYVDFTLNDTSSKKVVKKLVLVNCKS
ncbi:hypothetical protein [Aquimarina sp. 2304DJ70-9]|uniref:hypothetical protein n=1 Tax=Aquimarina penaris TaxID=3231044 RepID=UPI003461C6A4